MWTPLTNIVLMVLGVVALVVGLAIWDCRHLDEEDEELRRWLDGGRG